MSFETVRKGGVEYLRSTLLDTPHCFSTRFGGVSEGIYAALNLGIHRGDKWENCLENYRRLGEAVGFTPDDIVFNSQVHGIGLRRVTGADCGKSVYDRDIQPLDGLLTNEPGPALAAFGADCPTILYYDPVCRAVAAVHSGWRGTVAGMAAEAVRRMGEEFGSRPEHIRAAIGPCICKNCFETHADVAEPAAACMDGAGAAAVETLPYRDAGGQKYRVDLKLLNELFLRRAGVEQIDVCPSCTACEPERFWSHRVTKGARGSQASIILLKP